MYYDPAIFNFPPAKENFIAVYNRTSTVLRACEPAFVQGIPEKFSPAAPYFTVDAGYDPLKIWGVPAHDIAPHAAGSMQISGICRAFVRNGWIGDWVNASPGNGISTDEKGTARLWHPGTATEPGVVQLGFSGGGSSYNGAFKVTRGKTPGTVSVSRGYTDLISGWDRIDETEVPVTPQDKYICFCAKRNVNDPRFYDVFITADTTDAIPEFTVILADLFFIEDELFSITQRWMGGQGIFFGGRYML